MQKLTCLRTVSVPFILICIVFLGLDLNLADILVLPRISQDICTSQKVRLIIIIVLMFFFFVKDVNK